VTFPPNSGGNVQVGASDAHARPRRRPGAGLAIDRAESGGIREELRNIARAQLLGLGSAARASVVGFAPAIYMVNATVPTASWLG
jgi:hypothetical protein